MKLFTPFSKHSILVVLLLVLLLATDEVLSCSYASNSNGLMLQLARKMKSTQGGRLYDLGGVYYDAKGKLTLGLAPKPPELPTRSLVVTNTDPFRGVNATEFKELLLEIYGPSILLSQLKPKKAEKIMQKAEKNANKRAKKADNTPPSARDIDADVRATLTSDHLRKIDLKLELVEFPIWKLDEDFQRLWASIKAFPEVVSSDLDEERNRIHVEVASERGVFQVEKMVSGLGIDSEELSIEVRTPSDWILDDQELGVTDGPSLQDRRRPIQGGLFIEVPTEESLADGRSKGCSIGFVAQRVDTGEVGFVTASHCTVNMDGIDAIPMKAFQLQRGTVSPPQVLLVNQIGTETSDQYPLFSDSAFFTFTNGVPYGTGIYKTQADGNNVIKQASRNSWYSLRIDSGSLVNEIVYKIGRNTGQTRGRVTRTCVNYKYETDDVSYKFECQDEVMTVDPNQRFQWKGDSGAATIYTLWSKSRFAWIRGISFGRSLRNTEDPSCVSTIPDEDKAPTCWDHYVSPINGVQCDHGPLLVHYNDVPDWNA